MDDGEGEFKPRRVIVGAVILLLIAAGLGLLSRRAPSPPTPMVKSALAPATMRRAVDVQAPSAPKAIESDGISPGNTVEFCGLGKVTVDPDDPSAGYRYLEGVTHQVAQQWLSALLDSDDTRARVAGLLLEGKIDGESQAAHPMTEQRRDEMVALAIGAGDPALYAMALAVCGKDSTPLGGTCRQLSLATWARMDPDNAMPWMLLAGKAQARNDPSAASEYFERAARAKKVDAYIDTLFAYAEPEIPGDASALQRWYLTVQTFGVSAAMVPSFAPAFTYCSSVALQDDQIRGQCAAVAELMVSSSTTLLEYGEGVSLGARTGWSPTRVRELTEQREAWMQVEILDANTFGKEHWSCTAVETNNARVRRFAQVGELAALREQLEASGKTTSELARQHRAWLEQMATEAQRRARDSQAEQGEATPVR